jgi:hypothetical protein
MLANATLINSSNIFTVRKTYPLQNFVSYFSQASAATHIVHGSATGHFPADSKLLTMVITLEVSENNHQVKHKRSRDAKAPFSTKPQHERKLS